MLRKTNVLSGQAKSVGETDFKQHLQEGEGKRITLDLEEQTEQELLGESIWLGLKEEIVDENPLGRQIEGDYGNL